MFFNILSSCVVSGLIYQYLLLSYINVMNLTLIGHVLAFGSLFVGAWVGTSILTKALQGAIIKFRKATFSSILRQLVTVFASFGLPYVALMYFPILRIHLMGLSMAHQWLLASVAVVISYGIFDNVMKLLFFVKPNCNVKRAQHEKIDHRNVDNTSHIKSSEPPTVEGEKAIQETEKILNKIKVLMNDEWSYTQWKKINTSIRNLNSKMPESSNFTLSSINDFGGLLGKVESIAQQIKQQNTFKQSSDRLKELGNINDSLRQFMDVIGANCTIDSFIKLQSDIDTNLIGTLAYKVNQLKTEQCFDEIKQLVFGFLCTIDDLNTGCEDRKYPICFSSIHDDLKDILENMKKHTKPDYSLMDDSTVQQIEISFGDLESIFRKTQMPQTNIKDIKSHLDTLRKTFSDAFETLRRLSDPNEIINHLKSWGNGKNLYQFNNFLSESQLRSLCDFIEEKYTDSNDKKFLDNLISQIFIPRYCQQEAKADLGEQPKTSEIICIPRYFLHTESERALVRQQITTLKEFVNDLFGPTALESLDMVLKFSQKIYYSKKDDERSTSDELAIQELSQILSPDKLRMITSPDGPSIFLTILKIFGKQSVQGQCNTVMDRIVEDALQLKYHPQIPFIHNILPKAIGSIAPKEVLEAVKEEIDRTRNVGSNFLKFFTFNQLKTFDLDAQGVSLAIMSILICGDEKIYTASSPSPVIISRLDSVKNDIQTLFRIYTDIITHKLDKLKSDVMIAIKDKYIKTSTSKEFKDFIKLINSFTLKCPDCVDFQHYYALCHAELNRLDESEETTPVSSRREAVIWNVETMKGMLPRCVEELNDHRLCKKKRKRNLSMLLSAANRVQRGFEDSELYQQWKIGPLQSDASRQPGTGMSV